MSFGTKTYAVRLNEHLVEDAMSVMQSRNSFTTDTEWSFSDFVRMAIREKIAHHLRSRKSRRKGKVNDAVRTPSTASVSGLRGIANPSPSVA